MKLEKIKGKTLEEIEGKAKQITDEYKVLTHETIRKKPMFWKKEIVAQVLLNRKDPEIKEVVTKVEMVADKKEIKQRSLIDVLEGKKDAKVKTTGDFLAQQKKEMDEIKKSVKEMVRQAEEEKNLQEKVFASETKNPIMDEIKNYLMEEDVDLMVAEDILRVVEDNATVEKKGDYEYIMGLVEKEVEKRFEVSHELEKGENKIIAFIGPTGVGKTTTLAKLAGTYKLAGKKIGLITTDVYRIGAVDQLDIYAKILTSPIKTASSPEALKEAIEQLEKDDGVDHILIDTVGRSPMDPDSIDGMNEYLQIAKPNHTTLVLSATQKQRDVLKILDNYQGLGLDSLIFTKLDETLTYGVLLNAVEKGKMKISYITDGQNVPMDIYQATASELTKMILTGVEKNGSSNRLTKINE